jgi:hypothetical protein
VPTVRSLLGCGWIKRSIRSLPMTLWLLLMPFFGMQLRDVIVYLPFFLVLDYIRHRLEPDQTLFLAWLERSLESARAGETAASPSFDTRYGWSRWVIRAVAVYALALVFFPPLRSAVRILSQSQAIGWLYGAVGRIYSPVLLWPADAAYLGHLDDAADLQHFLVVCILFSLVTLFVYTGPAYLQWVKWSLLEPIREAAVRKSSQKREPNAKVLAALGILPSSGLQWMFLFASTAVHPPKGYWKFDAYPPLVMFMLSMWLFSFGVSCIRLALDMSAIEARQNAKATLFA